jgi:hypothetical protein
MSKSDNTNITRRALLRGGSLYGGGLYLALNIPRPLAAAAAQKSSAPLVFSEQQWLTVEGISARIIPTDHQPGAVEANCVNFIDKALANEDAASKDDFLAGLKALDGLCKQRFRQAFVQLNEAEQDNLLTQMEAGEASPWETSAISDVDFFELVRAMTIMGFMADPKYGGNEGFAGWKVARYPGPRHAQGGYTPEQMLGEEEIVTIWGGKQ